MCVLGDLIVRTRVNRVHFLLRTHCDPITQLKLIGLHDI